MEIRGVEPHHARQVGVGDGRRPVLREEGRGEAREDRNPVFEADVHGNGPHVLVQDQRHGPLGGRVGEEGGQVDGGAHGGVAREGHLDTWREDADAGRTLVGFGRPQEDGLGEVHLPGDALHEVGRQMRRVGKDAQGIAAEGVIREDVEGGERRGP